MDMPSPVHAYFEADRTRNADAFTDAFAADAVVKDEGASRTGHAEIRKWWLAAKEKYDDFAEPFEAKVDGETVTVRAKVTGNFPNSPATLQYEFHIVDGKIAELEIG